MGMYLLGWVLLLVCIGLFAYEKKIERKAAESFHWPSVTGEIVQSRVRKNTGGYTSGSGNTFKAEIEYRYEVEGRKHRGNNVCIGFDVGTGSRQRAEDRCAQYPEGANVPVYYSPDDPTDACLERRADAAWVVYTIAAAFGFFGFGIITGFIRF